MKKEEGKSKKLGRPQRNDLRAFVRQEYPVQGFEATTLAGAAKFGLSQGRMQELISQMLKNGELARRGPTTVAQDRAAAQAVNELAGVRAKYRDLLTNYTRLERKHELFLKAEKLARKARPVVISQRLASERGEATALLVASDWHVFETVRPEEVSGLNEFNQEIAGQRIRNFFHAAVRWTEINRGGTQIKTCILALLGDLMTNQLHMDQLEDNAGTPQEEMLFLLDHLIGGLDYLLKQGGFDRLVVACCDGNHGRDTEKLRHSNRVKHSHEWLLYCLLARHYAGDRRVEFSISEGTHLLAEVYGRTIRFHHGDALRYKGGVGGLTIPVNKAIAQWDKGVRADFDVFGHWHTRHMDSKFFSNGSLIGYSPYALDIKAPFELPQQGYLLLDKKRWITADNRIYV